MSPMAVGERDLHDQHMASSSPHRIDDPITNAPTPSVDNWVAAISAALAIQLVEGMVLVGGPLTWLLLSLAGGSL